MEFTGTFIIEKGSPEEVWLSFFDPHMNKKFLPGCQFLTKVPDPDDFDFDALAEAESDDLPLLSEGDPADVAAGASRRANTMYPSCR